MKKANELQVPLETGAVTAIVYEAGEARLDAALVLAHGAGADQRSAFMTSFASAFASRGLDTITFNFLYTEQRRKVPDRRLVLEACYRSVISAVRHAVPRAGRSLFIGGKSMGGRIATHLAAGDANVPVSGLVLLGYPLHPPGRPTERRDAHLPDVRRPMLFVQGSRDAFGTPAELTPILAQLRPAATLHVVDGGDHSFKIGRANEQAQTAVYDDVQRRVVEWIGQFIARAPQGIGPQPR